jgi:hypothetical protein
MQDPAPTPRLMLRSFCLVAGVLAVAIAGLGWFPGYELERQDGLDVLAVSSSPAGLTAVMVIFAGLATAVWRHPSLANAMLASMAAVGASVFLLALTAAPRLESGIVVDLPAAALASQLVLTLVVLQIAVVPVACGLFALRARARRAERIARARVHRIGS